MPAIEENIDFKQGMRQHGCSGCMNPQIFETSPFAPADFEASSTVDSGNSKLGFVTNFVY